MAKKFIQQLDIAKVPINVSAFGRNFIVTDAVPHIRRDTQERTGTDYEVVCVDYDFEKIKVSISGPQTISNETLSKGHPRVTFNNMTVRLYNINSHAVLSIKADQINLVK